MSSERIRPTYTYIKRIPKDATLGERIITNVTRNASNGILMLVGKAGLLKIIAPQP